MFRIILIFIMSLSTYASDCKSVKWPYSRDQKKSDFHKIFQMNSFDTNLSYLMHEVSQNKISDLESYLFIYLTNTPNDKNILSFIETVKWARLKKDKSINPIKEKEFCDLYKKSFLIK